MQVCWGKLEQNSAGHRPSRTKFEQPCSKGYKMAPKISNESKRLKKNNSISLCSLKKRSVRSKYICACLQNYCVSAKKLGKRDMIYINTSAFSQNFWETSRETLRSLTKHLHSLNLNCIRSLNTFAFSCKLLCVPKKLSICSQNYYVYPRNFAFDCKTFAFSIETLHSLAKHLHFCTILMSL